LFFKERFVLLLKSNFISSALSELDIPDSLNTSSIFVGTFLLRAPPLPPNSLFNIPLFLLLLLDGPGAAAADDPFEAPGAAPLLLDGPGAAAADDPFEAPGAAPLLLDGPGGLFEAPGAAAAGAGTIAREPGKEIICFPLLPLVILAPAFCILFNKEPTEIFSLLAKF
jgi:hypothetical protein